MHCPDLGKNHERGDTVKLKSKESYASVVTRGLSQDSSSGSAPTQASYPNLDRRYTWPEFPEDKTSAGVSGRYGSATMVEEREFSTQSILTGMTYSYHHLSLFVHN